MPKKVKFRGKLYGRYWSVPTKRGAMIDAKELRKAGFRSHVAKENKPSDKSKPWSIYLRIPKGKTVEGWHGNTRHGLYVGSILLYTHKKRKR